MAIGYSGRSWLADEYADTICGVHRERARGKILPKMSAIEETVVSGPTYR